MTRYAFAPGGLPPQSARMDERAVFTEAYAFLPASTMRDITTSALPFWDATRAWVIARPMSGFSETFSHYLMEVAPGGGSDRPDTDPGVQGVIFVSDGRIALTIDGTAYDLGPGGYAYLPAGARWSLRATGDDPAKFHWVRKRYQAVDGIDAPDAFVTSDEAVDPVAMPDTNGRWATTRFVDPADLRHDMHVNIVTLKPGAVIPFPETHVMEHGLYVLAGKAAYKLNRDWVEVEGGDFMWLRAFCPQACYAGGDGPFRYLLYKDVNRHAPLP
ncbi:bifunctional allantoicase/(S)-ureidoglycine aminohydrolase [Palleronia sp. LCG004]|uniref:bifunctional allantoicase/(S)-ureidoglycine aminohydrolase n=1 Tax=Palleronia sp. LCG004 TaxID=3079304 RepID=UPI002941CC82|nr:bifunctional allantoicase/(S)-ureidoglycine aminohydrolase [Palleronia sp. LCG004]WOI56552.1 bifunctional allantoicase/(S)-ureidoglycine aminohydrolase [Palleronia sp. LCG004]